MRPLAWHRIHHFGYSSTLLLTCLGLFPLHDDTCILTADCRCTRRVTPVSHSGMFDGQRVSRVDTVILIASDRQSSVAGNRGAAESWLHLRDIRGEMETRYNENTYYNAPVLLIKHNVSQLPCRYIHCHLSAVLETLCIEFLHRLMLVETHLYHLKYM